MSEAAMFAGGAGKAPEQSGATSSVAAGRQEQRAALLQFPRRVLFLFVAYGLAMALVSVMRALLAATLPLPPAGAMRGLGDWSVSWTARRPVAEMVRGALPNTLTLVGAALAVALALALLWTLVALLVHRLERRARLLASILTGLGRLCVLGPAAAPVLGTGALLLFILGLHLRLLPVGGMARPGDPSVRLPYLVLPVMALSLLPAALAAQAVARELVLPPEAAPRRRWLAALLQGLGILFAQVGGMLSATVLVETLFSWPGLGRYAVQATANRDYPMLFGAVSAFAALVLAARLLAELCRWLERLLRLPAAAPDLTPAPPPRRAHAVWLVLALALLVLPPALAASGLLVSPAAAIRQSPQSALLAPSPAHPLGTDPLGRDVLARLLRGATVTLGLAALATALVFIPALLGGALAGDLAGRRQVWAESLADLLLLPADTLLLFPALPGAMLVLTVLVTPGALMVPGVALATCTLVAAATALLPRAIRAGQALWLAVPARRWAWALGLAGAGALFFGALFAAFGLVTGLEFLGLGAAPPTPSLGGELAAAISFARQAPAWLPAAAVAISACAFALYVAADALVGLLWGREALARLHE